MVPPVNAARAVGSANRKVSARRVRIQVRPDVLRPDELGVATGSLGPFPPHALRPMVRSSNPVNTIETLLSGRTAEARVLGFPVTGVPPVDRTPIYAASWSCRDCSYSRGDMKPRKL
jgi:hypothetical protein